MDRNYHVAGINNKEFLSFPKKITIGKLHTFWSWNYFYVITTSALVDIIGSIEGNPLFFAIFCLSNSSCQNCNGIDKISLLNHWRCCSSLFTRRPNSQWSVCTQTNLFNAELKPSTGILSVRILFPKKRHYVNFSLQDRYNMIQKKFHINSVRSTKYFRLIRITQTPQPLPLRCGTWSNKHHWHPSAPRLFTSLDFITSPIYSNWWWWPKIGELVAKLNCAGHVGSISADIDRVRCLKMGPQKRENTNIED